MTLLFIAISIIFLALWIYIDRLEPKLIPFFLDRYILRRNDIYMYNKWVKPIKNLKRNIQ